MASSPGNEIECPTSPSIAITLRHLVTQLAIPPASPDLQIPHRVRSYGEPRCAPCAGAMLESFSSLPRRLAARSIALLKELSMRVKVANTKERDRGSISSIVSRLKTCCLNKELLEGEKIHAEILAMDLLATNPYVGCSLITMYAKCGTLPKSQEVFDGLEFRNVVMWNALISGYVQHGRNEETLSVFDHMKIEGSSPDAITYICCLKACTSMGAIDKGMAIHDEIAKNDTVRRNVLLDTTLVTMYAKCRMLEKAQELFDTLMIRTVVSWNALINGYVHQGQNKEALNYFEKMQKEGFSPDVVTYICALKACGTIRALDKGKQIHHVILQQKLIEEHILLGTALVSVYAKCGALDIAEQVLRELPNRKVVCWNALIAGSVEQGRDEKALTYFERMVKEGIQPNAVTYICILKACGSTGSLEKGKQAHEWISKSELLEKHSALGNALVDMYAKCGALTTSRELFEELPVHDMVGWNSLICGYSQQCRDGEALGLFYRMQKEGFVPDPITFASTLKSCASIGAISTGKEIHEEIKKRSLERDVVISTALMDMYAKCGDLEKVEEVFGALTFRDVACWTTRIAGYAYQRLGKEALTCFEKMQEEGLFPDPPTFLCVLNACSLSGLVDRGETYFMDMTSKYGFAPGSPHLNIMVGLLGGAGYFDKALALIPGDDDSPCRFTLLGACQKWGNADIAWLTFKKTIQID